MVFYNPYGRLGNFLFMAACAIAYSKRHGLEFTVPSTTNHSFWNVLALPHLINPNFNLSLPVVDVNEKHFHYAPIPFENWWNEGHNIRLNGYWQSEKYFEDYKDEVIKLFNLPYEEKEGCAIHARFTDYLTIPGKHIVMDFEYLTRAISYIQLMTDCKKFVVFSDDLNYFKNNFGHVYNFEYSEGKSPEQDLVEMSCYQHQICSSSTFAWWGMYLNKYPKKQVVFPKRWFQEGWKDEYNRIVDTSDILPNYDWITKL